MLIKLFIPKSLIINNTNPDPSLLECVPNFLFTVLGQSANYAVCVFRCGYYIIIRVS